VIQLELYDVKGGDPKSRPATMVKLSDLGITKSQSSKWQRLADMEPEEFEFTGFV
jgi:hypothetical protein